jgi:F-box interacting protein
MDTEEDKEESSKKKLRQDSPPATAASLLTNDLILEVLSHLPARSVRRFKCVSTAWRDLIADPAHRKKLPQTLAGFLYNKYKPGGALSGHFASVSGGALPVDPSLHFLQPNKFRYIALEDTCNGLLLCACYNKETPDSDKDEYRHVVCNPATERWIELPPPPQALANRFYSTTRLAFDPAVSSHFHVLQFWQTISGVENCARGVDIFSSKTGAWIHRDSGLLEKITLFRRTRSVFFCGMLHLVGRLNTINVDKESALMVLVQVDMEGKAWKTIHLPIGSSFEAIGLSQGCLYYAGSTTQTHISKKNIVQATKITLWCLENHDSKEWVLKHSASINEPLGIIWVEFRVFAIHPDCSTVFLVPIGGDMLAYDMQHHKFVDILNLEKDNVRVYLPYVPLFSEALADADGQ